MGSVFGLGGIVFGLGGSVFLPLVLFSLSVLIEVSPGWLMLRAMCFPRAQSSVCNYVQPDALAVAAPLYFRQCTAFHQSHMGPGQKYRTI
jgi:hypothetical protein